MEEENKDTLLAPDFDGTNSEKEIEITQQEMNNLLTNNETSDFSEILQSLESSIGFIGDIDIQPMIAGLSQLSQSIQQTVTFSVQSMEASIKAMADALVETIADIQIPTLSEDQKNELFESQQQWGRLGWTWFIDAPVSFYNDPPINPNDAYDRIKPFCSSFDIERLFNKLCESKARKSDLDSAIFCYQNRQYKACALLLFGIIESKMIREMPKPKGKAKRRPVGASAVKLLKRTVNQSKKDLFMLMHIANLFACLETFFANADDFKREPPTINRNFIGHGMNRRQVRKRDCIQLFLLLQNLQLYQKFSRK